MFVGAVVHCANAVYLVASPKTRSLQPGEWRSGGGEPFPALPQRYSRTTVDFNLATHQPSLVVVNKLSAYSRFRPFTFVR